MTDQKVCVLIPDDLEKNLVVSTRIRSIYSNHLWALRVIETPEAHPYGKGWEKVLRNGDVVLNGDPIR